MNPGGDRAKPVAETDACESTGCQHPGARAGVYGDPCSFENFVAQGTRDRRLVQQRPELILCPDSISVLVRGWPSTRFGRLPITAGSLGTNWGQGWRRKPNLVTIQSIRQFFVSDTLEGTCSILPT